MKRSALLAIPLLLASSGAFAAQFTTTGDGALALAALIGEKSPALSHGEKVVLARFLAGQTAFTLPSGMTQIIVSSSNIHCRVSHVSIVAHSCELTLGSITITVAGRRGQELVATMIENGVWGEGTPGTIHYAVAPITCTVDPAKVQEKDGTGAKCVYTGGP